MLTTLLTHGCHLDLQCHLFDSLSSVGQGSGLPLLGLYTQFLQFFVYIGSYIHKECIYVTEQYIYTTVKIRVPSHASS